MSADLREKLILTALGFLLTGVLGALVSTWIQQRGWAWQNRVASIEKDTQNALDAYRNVSDLANGRWYAAFRVVQVVEHGADASEWASVRENFEAVDKDWAIKYTSAARDLAFYVDTPFRIDARDKLKLARQLACDDYALGGALDGGSARLALEVVNNCSAMINDGVREATQFLAHDGSQLDAASRKTFIDLAYRRLDALYKTNETLRCVILIRAYSIRRSLALDSFWRAFFGLDAPSYPVADTKECLA